MTYTPPLDGATVRSWLPFHAAALLREVEDDAAPHSQRDGHQVDRSLRHVQHVLQRDVVEGGASQPAQLDRPDAASLRPLTVAKVM